MKDNSFTVLIPAIGQQELATGVHMSPPSHFSPLWVVTERVTQEITTGIYFMNGNVCFHAALSIHLTLSSLPAALVHSLFSIFWE